MATSTIGTGYEIQNNVENLEKGLAIVQTGNTATQAITAGQFVYWKGTMYTASTAIASGTSYAVGTNLTACPNGGLNTLNEKLEQYTSIDNPVSGSDHSVAIPAGTKALIARLNYHGASPQAFSTSISIDYLLKNSNVETRLFMFINASPNTAYVGIKSISSGSMTIYGNHQDANDSITLFAVS